MNDSKTFRRLVLLSTLLVLSSVIAAGVYTRTSKSQKKSKDYGRTYEAAKVNAAPPVTSSIKGLDIAGVSVINQGTPDAALSIDVTNNRDEAVVALDFIAGKNNYSGLRIDGLLQEDDPLIIIPPHSLKTFNWSLGSIMEGETVNLAVAIFADGKEEGDKRALGALKKRRIRLQEKMREQRIKNGGQK